MLMAAFMPTKLETAVITQLIRNLEAGKKQTVVAYGTSLTAGGQWVRDLEAWLEARYPGLARVINNGQSGKASRTALAFLEENVLAHRPDTVFLEFAVNDATTYEPDNLDYSILPEESVANLNRLIDRILADNPSTEIIVQTMNPAWDAPNGNRSGSRRPDLSIYYEGYRHVARQRSLRLIDHHANWSHLREMDSAKFESYVPDGVHPTAEGSTAVTFAEIQLKFLTELTE